MAPRTSPDLVIRKKMRKGTHSCFECRRRKIRCIYPPENPNVCSECFARGSRCIDQELASSDVVVDHRKNLRERVSRLESLIDTLLEDKSDRGAAEALRDLRGEFPLTPKSSEATASSIHDSVEREGSRSHSLFDPDALKKAAEDPRQEPLPPGSYSPDCRMRLHSITNAEAAVLEIRCQSQLESPNIVAQPGSNSKHEQATRALLEALPPYDKLNQILLANGEWWSTWRAKMPGTTGPDMSIAQFANYALNKKNPVLIGLLVLSYGVSVDRGDIDHYLALLDHWILSDDEYAATLEGMECLCLAAKCYADIGQPRRSWLAFRRGLVFAQLLGLHRNHASSVARDSIWWSMYQGDRMISLLLGLPHGVSDAHCDLEPKGIEADPKRTSAFFLVKISIIAGQIIDRTHGGKDHSYSSALDLDQDLENIGEKVPDGWWDLVILERDFSTKPAVLMERLLAQIAYHQIRVYLHLPFMLKSATNPRFEYSRSACFSSAREVLRLYHRLRSGNGEPLYECKAVDFLGFTAGILLMLGLLGYCRLSHVPDPAQEESDWRLVEISMDIFQRASSEKGGKVAAQSYNVLDQLRKIRDTNGHDAAQSKIVIPYFGTISVQPGKKVQQQPTPETNPSQGTSPQLFGSTELPQSLGAVNSMPPPMTPETKGSDPFIAYDGLYLPDAGLDGQTWDQGDGMGSFANPPSTNFNWMTNPTMDIDQDWSWFLNGDAHAAQLMV